MNLLPLIGRELRLTARCWSSYYLRTIGASSMLFSMLVFYLDGGLGSKPADKLFVELHSLLFWGLLVLIPILSFDSISRERREGTLGLLFMTGLKPSRIVAAKGLVHAIRALTLWLAVIPVMAIPLLLGGVELREIGLSLVLTFAAVCSSLAAGLLASALNKNWLRALLGATVLVLVFIIGCATLAGLFLLPGIETIRDANLYATTNYSWPNQIRCGLATGLHLLLSPNSGWYHCLQFLSADELLWALIQLSALSSLVLLAALHAGGAHLRRVWQDQPNSRWGTWQQKVFHAPIFCRGITQRRLKRKMEINPVGWLEKRSWTARAIPLAWLAIIMVLAFLTRTVPLGTEEQRSVQDLAACLLSGAIALSASASFRHERETGLLELLLVSPIGETAIVRGRLVSLWSKFLPAITLLCGLWWYHSSTLRTSKELVPLCLPAFLALPVIGLHYSLRCTRFIAALAATVTVGLVIPFLLSTVLNWTWSIAQPDPTKPTMLVLGNFHLFGSTYWVVQLVVAAFLLRLMLGSLRTRSFLLEPGNS